MTDVKGTQEQKIVDHSGDDLTEIKGIGVTTAEKLYNAKIVSILQIAKMTPELLSKTPGIGLATATKFITAAKNCLESSPEKEFVEEPIDI
ncbi:MAG: helix-hairpin-helix domain-containing protein, partial [Promethearchaeota archaeon]